MKYSIVIIFIDLIVYSLVIDLIEYNTYTT